MKTLIGALLGLAALLGPPVGPRGQAAAQGPVTRIAYDQCYALDYEIVCDVHILVDGADTLVARGGAGPKWSPDGSRIAFVGTTYDTQGEIFVATLADGRVANVSNHPAYDGAPAWSRDGGRIAFASDRDGSFELHVMNADGSNPTRLTYNVGFTGAFAWSPDGGTIAFTSDRDGSPELYVMNADGSNPTRLTYNAGVSGSLTWSPDGSRIAFGCPGGATLDICATNTDGTNFVRLTSDPASDDGATFSPVDGRIAFVTTRFGAEGEIAVLEADLTVRRVGAAGGQPAWSPDGSRLVFVGTTVTWSGRCYFDTVVHPADDFCVAVPDIYVVNVDGTALTMIASGGSPEWFTPLPGRPVAAFTYQCSGSTCALDGSGSFDPDGTITSYGWQFGDGTSGSGATASHTYAPGGRYTVTLTVTDDAGGTGAVSTSVDANAAPVASFSVTCRGSTCTFDGSGSSDPDGTITSYSWYFGDGETSGSPTANPTATHTFATGTFTVTLMVMDNGGATGTQSKSLSVVNAPPVASFTVACSGLTCAFDGSGSSDPDGTIASFAWNFGDGTTGSGATVSHTYAAGSYTVTLTVTDNGGAVNTQSKDVTVTQLFMHVGDLDRAVTSQGSTWTAMATITVDDSTHSLVANATVSGAWSNGGTGSCATAGSGQCTVSKAMIPKKTGSVSFTVVTVTHATLTYKSADNHDPDGDSNGTSITVSRP